ncbi:MAG TPA: hypothetical protein V6C65_39375 [Allocoleopsis sp.]
MSKKNKAFILDWVKWMAIGCLLYICVAGVIAHLQASLITIGNRQWVAIAIGGLILAILEQEK